jgi:hypothetical protein
LEVGGEAVGQGVAPVVRRQLLRFLQQLPEGLVVVAGGLEDERQARAKALVQPGEDVRLARADAGEECLVAGGRWPS